eukprot:ANDGO_03566.mRNA.1 hypothetical protein
MSMATMPILLFNLGGEMLYVLHQRLTAQNISPEKGVRVLEDVSKAMFATSFVEELMKPQDAYSYSSLREIFDRLAHSSIMRLSKTSMDKLFDLMTMGVKQQLLSVPHPVEILDVTMNHLDAIEAMIASTSSVSLVRAAKETIISRYTRLTISQLCLLRQDLLDCFADRRVKVSLFLQDALQNQDGSFVIAPRGRLPLGCTQVGFISMKIGASPQIFKFTHPFGDLCEAGASKLVYFRDSQTRTKLGLNMYISRTKAANDAVHTVPAASESISPSTTPSSMPVSPVSTKNKTYASAALNLLSSLIVAKPKEDTFRLNLFSESVDEDPSVLSGQSSKPNSDVVVIDRSKKDEYFNNIVHHLCLDEKSEKASVVSDDDDDLLDLMDKTC